MVLCEGNGPLWAQGVNPNDYMLVCPNKEPMAVSQFSECNLAKVPAHAVVTRPETHNHVVAFLESQEVSKDLISFFLFLFTGLLLIRLHCGLPI